MNFEFYKTRSVSEVLVDTVQFTKKHYRVMLRPIITLLIIYGVLSALSNIFAYGSLLTVLENPNLLQHDSFIITFALAMLVGLLAFILIFAVFLIGFLGVRQVYENGSEAEGIDAGYLLRKILPGYLALSILHGLSYTIGLLFLVIPGIYLLFALYPSYGVYVIERKGVVESLKRGYQLSKGSWWFIVGSLLLMYLLMIGIDLVVSIPGVIIGFLLGAGPDPNVFLMQESFSITFFILVVLNTLGAMVGFLVYCIFGIHAGILYFTLRERKEGDSIAGEMSDFESELSDDQFSDDDAPADNSFTDSDPDSDRNNPDWR